MFRFADPYYLLALLLIPVLIYWYLRGAKRQSGKIKYSDIGLLKQIKPSFKQRMRHGLFALRVLAVTALILALARPQSSSKEEELSTEGPLLMRRALLLD